MSTELKIGDMAPDFQTATDSGETVKLSDYRGKRVILYFYPKDDTPGCTTQSCGFRDHHADLQKAGVAHLFGLSTQDTVYQREAAERLHLPFALLSDEKLALTRALRLPTFAVDGMTLLKRLTLVIDEGTITHAIYPVFPPDESAADTLAWLQANRSR